MSLLRFRKLGATLLAATVLAVASFTIAGVGNAHLVGACGYYVEHDNRAGAGPVFDYQHLYNTYATFDVVTHNNGCGWRYYVTAIHISSPQSNATYIEAGVRVWVCGTYKGGWYQANTGQDWSVISPQFYYGSCARQADDYNNFFGQSSFAYDQQWWSPSSMSAYVNQG
jgi:hypothetical protein